MPTPPTPTTFSVGEVLTAAKLNQASQVVTWITAGKPDLRVYATTTQSVPASTWTDITTFDTVTSDTESGWSAVTQKYTIAVTGIYVVQASVTFVTNTSSNWAQRVRIVKNGSAIYLAGSSLPHTGYYTNSGVTTSGVYPLTAGDTVGVQAWQNSSASRTTASDFSNGNAETSFLDIACIRTGAP